MRNKSLALILSIILLTIAPSIFAVVIQCPSLEGTTLTGDDAKNWKFKMKITTSVEGGFITKDYDYIPPATISTPTWSDWFFAPCNVKSITFIFNQVHVPKSSNPQEFSLICNGTYSMKAGLIETITTSDTITGERFISNAEYKHCDPGTDGHSFICVH